MLNDASRFTRLSVAGTTVPLGLLIALSARGVSGASLSGTRILLVGALAVFVMLAWSITINVLTRRAERRLRATVAGGSNEVVTGHVTGIPTPGRVVRRRVARKHRPYAVGFPVPEHPPASIVVLTVLLGDRARRAAALVPASLTVSLGPGAHVWTLLHPDRPEVAVLDGRPNRQHPAADPRWAQVRIPSDLRVAGGLLGAAAAFVAGTAVGFALGWLVLAI